MELGDRGCGAGAGGLTVLIDSAHIHVIAGKGGAGCISFRREKYVPKGGPDGGDGGRGGSVILEVNPHVRTLLDCREHPRYRATPGRPGQGNNRSGKNGEDLLIRVPPGTVVKNEEGTVVADLVRASDSYVAARGGRGGRGNSRFATATQQAPRRADPGEAGEEHRLELELKLIADVGLVGLPNAGKSTLLSRVSRARPKIAAYPFTTLEPNLGIAALDEERNFVVADLPGLIAGAHEGRGLGLQFLRHVERTRMIVFVVDASGENPREDLEVLLKEVGSYSPVLLDRPRLVALSKADLVEPELRAGAPARAGLPDAHLFSSQTGLGLRELLEFCWTTIAPTTPDEEHVS
jgi:GTP-binding protein